MDIDGAEYDALEGAKKTIIEYQPTLAVCVYHKRDDLINIPLLIKEYVPEYKLFCERIQDIQQNWYFMRLYRRKNGQSV